MCHVVMQQQLAVVGLHSARNRVLKFLWRAWEQISVIMSDSYLEEKHAAYLGDILQT